MAVAGTVSVLLGIGVALGFEGVLFDFRDLLLEYSPLIFGTLIAMGLALVAVLFEVKRFYGYAALVFGAWLAPYLMNVRMGIPVVIAGGAIAIVGLALLVSFLSKYSVPPE